MAFSQPGVRDDQRSQQSQLVLNWDQTDIRLVPSLNRTVESRGAQQAKIAHLGDKRQVRAMFLPPSLEYSYQCRSCMLIRQIIVTLTTQCLQSLIFGIP